MNDELWTEDSVTGNASGSYTFNRWTAREYVLDNMDELEEAAHNFGIDAATIGDKFLADDWEYFDVSIRCNLLAECIADVLDDIGGDWWRYFDEAE